MLNLVRARVPSILLFGTLQTAMWGFVYSQWREPSTMNAELKSAIPQGYIGKSRFAHAYELAHSSTAAAGAA